MSEALSAVTAYEARLTFEYGFSTHVVTPAKQHGHLPPVHVRAASHADVTRALQEHGLLELFRSSETGSGYSFGEDRLKVETPDNTDEEQNRRAEYDVAVDVGSGWTKVSD